MAAPGWTQGRGVHRIQDQDAKWDEGNAATRARALLVLVDVQIHTLQAIGLLCRNKTLQPLLIDYATHHTFPASRVQLQLLHYSKDNGRPHHRRHFLLHFHQM